jgi:hypothetical protein
MSSFNVSAHHGDDVEFSDLHNLRIAAIAFVRLLTPYMVNYQLIQ